MKPFTLKTRITLFFPLIITLLFACLFLLVSSLLQQYIKKAVSDQQFQLVSLFAEDIDRTIDLNSQILSSIGVKITPDMVRDPARALQYLKLQDEHQLTFDNGLFLFDVDGKMVAELPLGLSRAGADFSHREYFRRTVSGRKPFVSEPYLSSQQHSHPAIMFTSPLFDRSGALVGVLGGSVDLNNSAFFGRLPYVKMGKTGYSFLFNSDRLIVVHPDKSRIMKYGIPAGANPLLDRALAGFDGSGETVTSQGVHVLSSFKHLKTKNWILGANFPLAEAYAPTTRIRNAVLLGLPLLSLALFLTMRRYLHKITDPVTRLTQHVKELSAKSGDDRIFEAQECGEVETLGQAFNQLIRENDLHQARLEADLERYERTDQQLHRQNEYLQALHETTLGLIKRLDVASVLQAIVTRSGRLVGTEHCFLYLVNVEGTEMTMVYQSGIYDSLVHHPVKRGEGISGRVWDAGEPIRVDDYSLWEGRLPDADRNVLHAMAGVPLKVADAVVGVLGLAFMDEGALFNDQQMELLAQFGELASLALENARLNEESQRELTERKRAEEHLRKLSVAVEQSPVSIVITDTSGAIEYVNPYFSALTGYSFEEVLGQNPSLLKTGETGAEEYKKLWDTILAGNEWRGEFHNRKKDGDLYWEQALIAPIRDNSYAITHFIAIKEDITERKRLEGQLHHAQRMDAIGQLAGGIAHDFNNILTAIIGYASILQLKLPEGSPLRASAGQIAVTAERGAALTQGLLAFSRKQASNPVVADLNEIITRVHQLLLRLISEDIRLEINLAPRSLAVLADSGQLEQVLMNLATNARDAMPRGGSITITTETITLDNYFVLARGFGRPGRYALLTFSDTGDGMTDDIVKHIFEPFYTTKELGKGTGLGLSIVYGIIKKHNGYVICHSTSGLGTIFQIYLPLLDSVPEVTKDRAPEAVEDARGADAILMAEDNEQARKFCKDVLEEFGYTVITAVDGADALEKFKANGDRISLVILDVIMPKMNGREVYDAMRALDPGVRILFCSGYSDDVVAGQGGLGKDMNFLAKPFTPKELLMKIREVLEHEQ